jgi:hypothetical protein
LILSIWISFWQIFNSKLVLASPETASDADYAAILGVIGHEVCYDVTEGAYFFKTFCMIPRNVLF